MTKEKPDHIANAGKAIDFDRDGLCFANITQQKSCVNYQKQDGSRYEICKWQGLGTVCNYEDGKNGQ